MPRSFSIRSPGGHERIFTTMPNGRLLLTTNAERIETQKEKEVLMGVRVDDTLHVRIGTHLLALGIPVFGLITGIFPLPSVDGKFRLLINYHPLPQPNIRKTHTGIDSRA